MGWTNNHLWLIHARGSTWGVPDPDYADDTIPANRAFLLDMITDIGANRFEYVYDLGDHWSHTIKILKPMPAVPGIDYPLLEWPGPDFDPNDANHAKLETDVAALAKLMAPHRRASAKPKPKQKRRKRLNNKLF